MAIARIAPRIIQPKRRLALLVNQADQPADWSIPYSRILARSGNWGRGNCSIYQLEAALRGGRLDLRSDAAYHLEHREKITGPERDRRVAEACGTVEIAYNEMIDNKDPAWGYGVIERRANFSDDLSWGLAQMCFNIHCAVDVYKYRAGSRVAYEQILKVFPDLADPQAAVYRALASFSQVADKDTLTLMFVRAHGLPDRIGDLLYRELLDKLDAIAGKKVLVFMACHSGAVVDHVRARATAADYLVIPSTMKKDLGWNWGEDVMLDELALLVKDSRPLTEFGDARIFHAAGERQAAVPYYPFDAVL